MKQTIDNLDRWKPRPFALIFWALACDTKTRDLITEWEIIFLNRKSQDYRDAAFMAALTSKAGLPYKAKLIALQMEQ